MFDIIPAIDIIDGACVRLTRGDYRSKRVYSADPLEMAKQFEDAGIRRLHLVDLDGAKAGGMVNAAVLERIASRTSLVIDFGGGIKRDEDIRRAFSSGASMVTCGSIAVKNKPQVLRWIDEFGPEKLILGADVKDGLVALSGWLEDSDMRASDLIVDYMRSGLRKVISTEISRDGMLEGPSVSLYEEISAEVKKSGLDGLELIASGGVSSLDDLRVLQRMELAGVIIGKAIYEGRITLDELSRFAEGA
jgi:phosphoribosylformimino-5-aminoimidazole carboxamide ribotide isomerase